METLQFSHPGPWISKDLQHVRRLAAPITKSAAFPEQHTSATITSDNRCRNHRRHPPVRRPTDLIRDELAELFSKAG